MQEKQSPVRANVHESDRHGSSRLHREQLRVGQFVGSVRSGGSEGGADCSWPHPSRVQSQTCQAADASMPVVSGPMSAIGDRHQLQTGFIRTPSTTRRRPPRRARQ